MAVTMTKTTPTITAGAYSDNDSIGGVIEIRDAPSQGIIETILINDAGDQGPSLDLIFFESEPAGVADNAAFATITDADSLLICGIINENTWIDNITNQIAHDENVGIAYQTKGGSLWMMIRAATAPTFNATDDLQIRLGIVS